MKKNKGEGEIAIIIFIGLVIGIIISVFTSDKKDTGYKNNYSNDDHTQEEQENPYSQGTGHSAGYEWAEKNDVSDCGGNSQSFIEGCEEYLNQRDN